MGQCGQRRTRLYAAVREVRGMGKSRSVRVRLRGRIHRTWSSGCSWRWGGLRTRSRPPRPRISTAHKVKGVKVSATAGGETATAAETMRFRTPVFRFSAWSPSAAHSSPAGSSCGGASSARTNRRSGLTRPASPRRGVVVAHPLKSSSRSAPRAASRDAWPGITRPPSDCVALLCDRP